VTFSSEPPTKPNSREHRAAELVRYWSLCAEHHKRIIEALCKRFATEPQKPSTLRGKR